MKKRKMCTGVISGACLGIFLISGCASIIQGTSQSVAVETDPPGASITLDRTRESAITPASIVLKRKHEYGLEISKPGYRSEYLQMDRHFSGWFWCNLIFGGIIGIVVDVADGAAYKLEPKEVFVKLQPYGAEG